MRDKITLYGDQYLFFKELKSTNLLVAFVEFMFEDIEPTGLNGIEKVAFNSLRIRMENQKKKSVAGSMSHGGGRPRNPSLELSSENNTKTTQQTTDEQQNEQQKNKKYKDIYKEEKEIYKEKENNTKTTKQQQNNLEEYINAYNSSSLKNLVGDDEGAILEWLKYKQARKELYATPNSFLTQFKGYFNLVSPNEILPDVGKRLSFAIHTAIDNKWKGLVRDEKQKQLYEGYRKVDFSLKKKEQGIA